MAWTTPAHADFLVCNGTFDVVNLAVTAEVGDEVFSESWWVIAHRFLSEYMMPVNNVRPCR